MNYHVHFDDEAVIVNNIDRQNNTAILDGKPVHFDFRHVRGDLYSLIVDEQVFPVQIHETEGRQQIRIAHQIFYGTLENERQAVSKKLHTQPKAEAGVTLIKAPLPGLVVRLEVRQGDRVEKGSGLIVIEAMKMENEIKSPAAGTVVEVMVAARTTVEKDTVLFKIKS
ncbi:MAG: biotin/lipoyl-containing protein [bacterium]